MSEGSGRVRCPAAADARRRDAQSGGTPHRQVLAASRAGQRPAQSQAYDAGENLRHSARRARRRMARHPARAYAADRSGHPTGHGSPPCPTHRVPTACPSPARPHAGTRPSRAGCARRSVARWAADTRAGSGQERKANIPSPASIRQETEVLDKFMSRAMIAAGWGGFSRG